MVLAASLRRLPGPCAEVCVAYCAKAQTTIFAPRGLRVMVGLGAQFRSGLASTYVWLPEKSDVRLTSCPLVQWLTVFRLLKVAADPQAVRLDGFI